MQIIYWAKDHGSYSKQHPQHQYSLEILQYMCFIFLSYYFIYFLVYLWILFCFELIQKIGIVCSTNRFTSVDHGICSSILKLNVHAKKKIYKSQS